jgi:flagellar motor switch protein FliG
MRSAPRHFNGPAILAAMFRELDPIFRKELFAKLEQVSPIIARTVERLEFVYSDLLRLEDQSLQLILRLFPEKDWLLAWKMTAEPLRERLLANMSKNKRDDFLREAARQRRVPKTHVVRLQMAIARKAHELLAAGKLRLKSRRILDEMRQKHAAKKKSKAPKKAS